MVDMINVIKILFLFINFPFNEKTTKLRLADSNCKGCKQILQNINLKIC